ncbi:MAG: DUF192 domain-containing protein [Candidatus Micrarchaeota archaeon]|nr:DUF192 domain-containing protein [Candidatus Micrarchaeota archaeon]
MFTKLLYEILSFRTKGVKVKNTKLELLIADSLPKQILGLMHRPQINPNQGMLFVFRTDSRHSIWMYNMRFSIDCIWINEAGKVVDLVEGMKPCTSMLGCTAYYPKEEARYVLELRSGAAKRLGIKIGSSLSSIIRW